MNSINKALLCTAILACCVTMAFAQEKQQGYDIYLCIGQSNMAGRAQVTGTTALQPMEGVWLLNDKDEFEVAQNPLNRYSTIRKDISMQRLSIAYMFSKKMHELAGQKVGLVCNARGETSIKQWQKGAPQGYYEEAVRRTREAMKYGTLRGIIWHQGEWDCTHDLTEYQQLLKQFISDLRQDLANPDLPVVYGQISQWNWTKTEAGTQPFNDMIIQMPQQIPHTACVTSEGLTPAIGEHDPHFSSKSQKTYGQRFAEKMIELQTKGATFSYFSYTGHDARFEQPYDKGSQYLNPILSGFYPDPAVCRKGDTYYLVNSSFSFFPGVPIFESKDLVNWQQIGHVLDRESQLQLEGQWVSGGIYAPAISYNEKNQTFYMITTNVGKGGNFYVKTRDPHQGWSDPVYLPKVNGIDPSFLFDTDGRAYIVHNAPVFGQAEYEGQRAIHLLEFDVKGDSVIGEPIEIVHGGTHVSERPIWIEGPHLYHIGQYYYLMCAEGGTAEGHSEVIFRAKKPQGPWEECPQNPILTQRNLSDSRADRVTCTGHADLIQTAKGDWWAVFLGCRPYEDNMYNTGRETFLLPVTWKGGWPQILENGKAVPTVVGKKGLVAPSDLTGNFAYTDRFDGKALHPRWLFLRNPPANAYTLTDAGIVLHPSTGSVRQTKPLSALFCRQQHASFTAEARLSFAATSAKRLAGMTLFQDENHHFVFGKTLLAGHPAIVLQRTETEQVLIGSSFLPADDLPVRLKIEADGRCYSFYYALGDSEEWIPVAIGVDGANLSTARAGGFVGAMIGLYATRKAM